MKKKLICLLLALLTLVGSIPLTILSAAAEVLSTVSDDDGDDVPLVTIQPTERYTISDQYSTPPAKPDASGYVHFIITASYHGTFEPITVYYATEDGSAVAAAGDYEATSGSVTLTPENTSVQVSVKTARADYAITFHKHDVKQNFKYSSRSFVMKLTGVEGANARIYDAKAEVECALLADHNLEAYQFSDMTVLSPYTFYENYDLVNVLNTNPCDGGEGYGFYVPVSFPAHWAADYADTGIDAKLFMALQDAHIDESSWNSSSEVNVYIAQVSIWIKGEFHDNEEFGWGPAILGFQGSSSKMRDYYNENFKYVAWLPFDGGYGMLTKEKSSIERILEENYIIRRKWKSYGEPNVTAQDPGEYYIGLQDKALNWTNIEIALDSFGGYNRRLSGGTVTFRLEDIYAPEIEKDSQGKYTIYHNLDTATAGEKLRMAIRFKEPVHVNGKTPYFMAKVNGVGSGVEPHPYTIRFDYVGGSGTDTLYFEAEYSGDYHITSLTDFTFKNAKSIKDYSGTQNAFVPPSDLVVDGFNLDKRQPIISIPSTDAKMTTHDTSKTVAITVSNISEDATLYYVWTDSESTPPTSAYTNRVTLRGSLSEDYATVYITGEGDGRKFLHLKAVSRYGQEQTRIRIVGNATQVEKYAGPYLFDNTAPMVDENALEPQTGSTLETKVYKIPLPVDAGIGFSEISMYYVDANGTERLVPNKTYTAESFKSTATVETSLAAAEVGVGDNTRRTVTVFFAVTDALGNTKTHVAQQNVIFDTNTYINTEYVGSSDAFVDQTELMDDGYTMIYTGDAQVPVNEADVYYSFEFQVRSNEIDDGKTTIRVMRNGQLLEEVISTSKTQTHKYEFKLPMEEGYYDFQLLTYESGYTDPTRVSMVYRVYVGTGKGGLDEAVSNGTVLINKVYQLPAPSYFYSMNAGSTVGAVTRELYNGTALAASFSSKEKARGYVMFNEYRDLYAVTLTAELAAALNSTTSEAQKASTNEPTAMEGQVWIRYKSTSWSADSPYDKTKWVYYYYGTSEVIDVSLISASLEEALEAVTDHIVSRGREVSLPELSAFKGDSVTSLVSKLGPPTLASEQVQNRDKSLSDETCNSRFSSVVKYHADTAIYSSKIVLSGVEYVLMGNVTIPRTSRLQYKRIDESGREDLEWIELEFRSGQTFREALTESGKYRIRELGSGGVSVYNCYIDNDAPMVLVSWKGGSSATSSQILNQYSEKEFRARSFKIVSIDAREYDKYSYVALYKASGFELCGVYRLTDLMNSSVDVTDGDYYMVVADRAGNNYVMSLRINSSELKCEVTESENVRIRFTCNRKNSEIQEFYVKRNGILVSGKYAAELDFTESGAYEIYARDIYGNVYGPVTREFTRIYPEVEWKYRDETGHYVTYTGQGKSKQFSMEKVTDGVYSISTSAGLKFKITGDYGYTFLGIEPEHEENLKDGTVTVKNTQAFQLKVFYRKHPEVYTIYNCLADVSAPSIDATTEVDSPVPGELAAMREAILAGTILTDGNRLIPTSIAYTSTSTTTKHIVNKDTVLSDLIRVNVYDEGGLSYVHVYRNGKLVTEQSGDGLRTEIVLSQSGEYRIVAEDMLGNKSEFSFTNDTPESLVYIVDGLPYKLGLHDFENFDENGNYTDRVYGNDSAIFVISEQMRIFYMITDPEGDKHFLILDVNGTVIREAFYTLDDTGEIVLKAEDNILFSGGDPKTVVGRDYPIYEVGDTGINIYACVNSSGKLLLSVLASEATSSIVEARITTEDQEFYYTKTELSTKSSDLILRTTEGLLHIAETDEVIKLNRPFSISKTNFEENMISLAEVYYSETNDFADLGYLFKEEIYGDDVSYDQEGFYLIRLVNEYGNESTFIIHISYKFTVTSYAEFADGEKMYFSSNYQNPVYSNGKVVFEVYATGVNVTVQKDGDIYRPVISVGNGVTYVILSDDGDYTVTFSDAYRNRIERKAVINTQSKSFNENLLTGYNENALKKNEGYTNRKLSVDPTVLNAEGISYLEICFGDTSIRLFDSMSENGVELDEEKLVECIGNQGDGVYTVVVRNRYGTVMTKVIHYRATPTLQLEREIRTSMEAEAYDLGLALTVGFWSNSELFFKTDAETYIFTINKDRTECPSRLAFTSADQHGRSEYDITYVDEYGFSYSFKAYLVRQELEITPILGTEQYVDGMLTTTEDVSVSFSENASCTYTWNGSEEKVYVPGTVLARDGVYRFTVTDFAGNTTALTVKKDTVVEFEFTNTNASTVIQSGEVVNSSKVGFAPVNGDTAFIEKVYKDGVAQTDYDSTKFSEDGKWELIVSDKLGNKAYFCFYIVTKQKASFAYTTPYEYHVTELWYEGSDGVRISCLKFVNHGESSSSFEFTENGQYTVVMTSGVTGSVSEFTFTINNNAPDVALVGCSPGETTIHDVTLDGCVVGDKIKVYRKTRSGEELVREVEVTSQQTKLPTITEGGDYRIVVESEAGIATELSFVRKHVMNTEGSIFIIVVIALAVIGLFTGLVYRNKSKTDK